MFGRWTACGRNSKRCFVPHSAVSEQSPVTCIPTAAHSAAPMLLQNCGVVVEAHVIDERSEWRTFGDKVRMLLAWAGQPSVWQHQCCSLAGVRVPRQLTAPAALGNHPNPPTATCSDLPLAAGPLEAQKETAERQHREPAPVAML